MSKNRRSERVAQSLVRRSLAVTVALGALGAASAFAIVAAQPSSAEAQGYYTRAQQYNQNPQRTPDQVVFRNPTYYGPNAAAASEPSNEPGSGYYTPPSEGNSGFGNDNNDYGVGYGYGNSYGDGFGSNDDDYNADAESISNQNEPTENQVVFTNPNLSNSARQEIVPQTTVQQNTRRQGGRQCMWSDGQWRPESERPNAWSSWSGENLIYCQGDVPTPAYCWAMGFGVCPPSDYFPAYSGYYNYPESD